MKQCARFLGAVACCLVWVGCASVPDIALTQTLELPGTGHVMDYPAEWYVEVMEPLGAAVVGQSKVSLVDGLFLIGTSSMGGSGFTRVGTGVTRGYEVWFQQISNMSAVQALNLVAQGKPAETAQDMLRLARKWGWEYPEAGAIRDVVVAGVTAAVVELVPPPSAALFYATMIGRYRDVLILRVVAPTTKDLERFRPTWEKMLASIRPANRK